MRISAEKGNCLECNEETNIRLNNGTYACIKCLDRVGFETRNIKEWIENLEDKDNFLYKLNDFLDLLEKNRIYSIENIKKTLKGIEIYEKFKSNNLEEEIYKNMTKQLDFFTDL